MQEWRKFLREEVKFQGILKMDIPPSLMSEIDALRSMLPEKAVRLNPEDLHVTLVHQSILKPFKKQLKELELPQPPDLVLDDQIFERTSPGKKSWAVRLVNQEEVREYVKRVMEMLGSQNTNPEPERVFHVSLANLTGNPHDSVR